MTRPKHYKKHERCPACGASSSAWRKEKPVVFVDFSEVAPIARTCRIVMISPGWWECDECGRGIDWDSCDENDPPSCSYCPNCGRKVVIE